MKTLKLFFLSILAMAAVQSCKVTPEMKLVKVYVESGNIQADTLFKSNGAFKAADKAIGLIDSTSKCLNSHNGYVDVNNTIYVFENDTIPNNIRSLSPYKLYKCLTQANWQNPSNFKYVLPHDAEICRDSLIYYIREKGETPREEAIIEGNKAYRFKNSYFKENYSEFLNSHTVLVKYQKQAGYFNALKLNPEKYRIESSRSDLKIDSKLGTTDFANSTATPQRTTDKIYLKSTEKGQNYRIRTIYVVYNKDIIKQYFSENGVAKDATRWTEYFKKNVLPYYLEKTIKGYFCDKCRGNPQDTIGPPPKGDSGGGTGTGGG